MSKAEPNSHIAGPQPSPKRKLSLLSLETKRQRTQEDRTPTNVSADADSAQDDALSLGTPAAAEGAEVAFILEAHHVSSPSSLDRNPDGGIHPGVATSPSRTAHAKTRQVCPAHDLRGHIKCRLYPDLRLRPELHGRSVLHTIGFDDIYRQFCRTRDLEFNYSDEIPGRLFSLVISTYGDRLGHVCGSVEARQVILTPIAGPLVHRLGICGGRSGSANWDGHSVSKVFILRAHWAYSRFVAQRSWPHHRMRQNRARIPCRAGRSRCPHSVIYSRSVRRCDVLIFIL